MLEQTSSLDSDQQGLALPSMAPTAPLRLLVVDDDNLHRMIICRVASKAGFAPAGAATYEEAVQLSQDNAFDCITLDLSLGEHAGIEILRHLWVIGCKAPIIIVSGCDDATCKDTMKVAKSLNMHVWEAIPKPVDLVLLRNWLERLKYAREAAAAGVVAA